jgi:hypothetical protein
MIYPHCHVPPSSNANFETIKAVIEKFLKGKIPIDSVDRLEQIESAFYALGLRINRQQTKKASAQAINTSSFVLNTKAWGAALPYALPSCDLDKFQKLMQKINDSSNAERRNERNATPANLLLDRISRQSSGTPGPAGNEASVSILARRPTPVTSNAYFPGTRILCDLKSIIPGIYKVCRLQSANTQRQLSTCD